MAGLPFSYKFIQQGIQEDITSDIWSLHRCQVSKNDELQSE